MVREQVRNGAPGLPVLLGLLVALVAAVLMFATGAGWWRENATGEGLSWRSPSVMDSSGRVLLVAGIFRRQSERRAGAAALRRLRRARRKQPGLRWANPFYTKKRISQRVRNFESAHLKVNDKEGNPIEIAAVVVWSVVDTAEATFEVDDYENYVRVQSEAALRNAATSYPYDSHDEAT